MKSRAKTISALLARYSKEEIKLIWRHSVAVIRHFDYIVIDIDPNANFGGIGIIRIAHHFSDRTGKIFVGEYAQNTDDSPIHRKMFFPIFLGYLRSGHVSKCRARSPVPRLVCRNICALRQTIPRCPASRALLRVKSVGNRGFSRIFSACTSKTPAVFQLRATQAAFVLNSGRYIKHIVCPSSLVNLRSIAELITVPIRSPRFFEIKRY